MCLVLFSLQQHADYPLIVAANRDELYERPTQAAHFWEQYPGLFAGRDLRAGGTWMGITNTGRFAAVTNFREIADPPAVTVSRGELCTHFLSSRLKPEEYLAQLHHKKVRYAGFNLLVGTLSGTTPNLWYYSNRQQQIIKLPPGIHGLSNGLLNDPWPKVNQGKQALASRLEDSSTPETLLTVLTDTQRPADDLLPDTGIGLETERILSSRFIQSNAYGTRSSTIMRIDQQGRAEWLEQEFDHTGAIGKPRSYQIELRQ